MIVRFEASTGDIIAEQTREEPLPLAYITEEGSYWFNRQVQEAGSVVPVYRLAREVSDQRH